MKTSTELERMLSPAFKIILDSFLKNPDNKQKYDKMVKEKLEKEKENN